jgi:hypothetical protein
MNKRNSGAILAALTHPLTCLMILVLIVNDLFLKHFLPSFLSGKLSDFCLAYLLPLILIALGSLLPFPRLQRGLPWLGFSTAIFLFGFGKTIVTVNAFIYQSLSALLPFKTHFVLDASDALALVMLLPLAWVWQQSLRRPQTTAPRWKWVALPLLMAVTMADAAAPQYGIACLEAQNDGRILAESFYNGVVYQSLDGGLTWAYAGLSASIAKECPFSSGADSPQKELLLSSGAQLRFETGGRILESRDQGQTWQVIYSIDELSQAELAYRKHFDSTIATLPLPLDVIEEPLSGNVIAAMGQSGVLIRKAEGTWIRAAVMEYQPLSSLKEQGLAGYFSLLWVEWLMCVLQAVFLISLFNLRWRMRWWRVLKVVLAWLGWTLLLLFSPALGENYMIGISQGLGVPVAVVWAAFCLVDDFISWQKAPAPGIKRLILPAALSALLCMAIYFLWALNIIQAYSLALGLVTGLTLIFAIIGTIWSGALRRQEEKNE